METFKPRDEDELADVVRSAAARNGTLEIVGAGSKRALGRAADADGLLDVSALSGILTYEPDELILVARGATQLAEIEQTLEARGQMLGFAPPDWGPLLGAPALAGTLAGTVAANVCGPRRVKVGAVRDHLIGCRFVNGKGAIVKAGGRVVKNVTGFDIPKLMCGAFGTLGALTELTFRTVPRPERRAVVALRKGALADRLHALRRAAQLPIDATGLAYLPRIALANSACIDDVITDPEGLALIRVEGAVEPVVEKCRMVLDAFGASDPVVLEDGLGDALFGEIAAAALLGTDDLWRLVVAPSEAEAALTEAAAPLFAADWGGSLLWLALPGDEATAARLAATAARLNGHLTLFRASATARARLPVFPAPDAGAMRLARAVKDAFDPAHLFNPGRMYAAL